MGVYRQIFQIYLRIAFIELDVFCKFCPLDKHFGRARQRVDFRRSGLQEGRLIPVKPRACGGAGEGQALGLPRLYLKFHRHESRRARAYIR